jgi:hypothetical protein
MIKSSSGIKKAPEEIPAFFDLRDCGEGGFLI